MIIHTKLVVNFPFICCTKVMFFFFLNWKLCKKNILSPRAPWGPLKKKKNLTKESFLKLLVHISGMLWELFVIFEMWPPLSGGQLHCRLGAIQIRHHGATYAWKSQLCCSCQYTHSVCVHPIFLGCVCKRIKEHDIFLWSPGKLAYRNWQAEQCSYVWV